MPVAGHRGDHHGARLRGLQLDAALLVDAAARAVHIGQLHPRARHQPGKAAQHEALADDWLALLHAQGVDFTLAWRRLADAAEGREAPLSDLFVDRSVLAEWLARWRAAGAGPGDAAAMRLVSPFVVPRNHKVEEALQAASDEDDLGPFERLLAALRRPFEEALELAPYAQPAPAEVTARYQTFCGT